MINRRVQKTVGSKHLYSLAKRDYNAGHQPLRRWDNNAAWILIPWIYSHDLRFEIIDRRKPRWNETEWNIGQWPFKGEEGVVQGGYSISSRLAQHFIRLQRFTNAKTVSRVRPRYKPSKYRYSL